MSFAQRDRVYASRLVLGLLAGIVAATSHAEEWQAAVRAGDYARARVALESALRAQPDDTSLRYQHARVLGLLGSTEAALAEFDALLAAYPDDADYLLGRAQMLARLGRDAGALETTQRALALAPDYEDVWALRLRLMERSGDDAATTALRREMAMRFPGATWWQRAPEPTVHKRWISIGSDRERLSNGAPDWSRQFVRIDWQAPATSFYGETSRSSRFERNDVSLSAGALWQAMPQWRIGGDLTVTADAEFEPARELALAAQRSWSGGWGAELRYRRRDYDPAVVSSYSFIGDKYISDYRVAYRVDHSELQGSAAMGHALTLGWYPSEKRTLGLTIGAGEEIETVGLDQLLRTRVSSLTVNGRETLSPRVSLSWWLGTHEQGDLYRRRYGGISVRIGL
jgi:YaiO family outer membrane protein